MTTLGKSSLGKRSRGRNLAIMMGEEGDYDYKGMANDRDDHENGDPDGDQDAGNY